MKDTNLSRFSLYQKNVIFLFLLFLFLSLKFEGGVDDDSDDLGEGGEGREVEGDKLLINNRPKEHRSV